MLATPDRLVSWGDDDTLRFWSHDGEPLAGGGLEAHASIDHIQALPDRLVSWGSDGTLRLWSLDGELIADGASSPRWCWSAGILATADRLVRWSRSGRGLCVWTHDGELVQGWTTTAGSTPWATGLGASCGPAWTAS